MLYLQSKSLLHHTARHPMSLTSAINMLAPAWHRCLATQTSLSLWRGPHDKLLLLQAVTADSSLQMHMDGPFHITPSNEALAIDITRVAFTEWQGFTDRVFKLL